MKKFLFFKRSKRGFTLTELCIVIAVAAIVGIMITTTVILTSTQKEDIQTEAAFIKEVTDIQMKVNEWLKKYDNTDYEIAPNTEKSLLTAKNVKTGETNDLTFLDGSLYAEGEVIGTYKNVRGIEFDTSGGVHDLGEEYSPTQEASVVILYVTAQKGSGASSVPREQNLLFPLFAALTRDRIVDGKGQWK